MNSSSKGVSYLTRAERTPFVAAYCCSFSTALEGPPRRPGPARTVMTSPGRTAYSEGAVDPLFGAKIIAGGGA